MSSSPSAQCSQISSSCSFSPCVGTSMTLMSHVHSPGTDTLFTAQHSLEGVPRSTVYPEQLQVLGEGGSESWSLTAPLILQEPPRRRKQHLIPPHRCL